MNEIIWTNTAVKSYETQIDFLLENWSMDVVLKLENEISELLNKLKDYASLCPASIRLPSLRKCTINKYTSLVYSA